jgi:hypothetical protein
MRLRTYRQRRLSGRSQRRSPGSGDVNRRAESAGSEEYAGPGGGPVDGHLFRAIRHGDPRHIDAATHCPRVYEFPVPNAWAGRGGPRGRAGGGQRGEETRLVRRQERRDPARPGERTTWPAGSPGWVRFPASASFRLACSSDYGQRRAVAWTSVLRGRTGIAGTTSAGGAEGGNLSPLPRVCL